MVLEPLVCDSIDEQKYKKWEKLCYDNGGDINDIIIVIIKIKFVKQVWHQMVEMGVSQPIQNCKRYGYLWSINVGWE